MKQVAGRLRLDLAQYRELASFAQLSSDLDKATQQQLHRGQRTVEALKQAQNRPLQVHEEVCVLWAAVFGHLDDVDLPDNYARRLFSISSPLPPQMLRQARIQETTLTEGVRGFAFNADLASVVMFLDIGTRAGKSP